ncbi:hypothetical protein AAG906_031161 [Vitis piasezkii]
MADTKRKDRIAELYQALKKKNKYLAQICGDQPLEDPLQTISNIYDNTFLHLAIRFKQKDMVIELLRMLPKEGKPPLWNIKNKEGNTILHELACSDSMKKRAQEVLKIFRRDAYFCAARHGQTEMFKFLAEEMKQKKQDGKSHLQRRDNTTVLHISITTECFVNDCSSISRMQSNCIWKNMRQRVMEELMISLDPFKELGNYLEKIFNMCTGKDNTGNGDASMISYKRCSPILQKLVKLLKVKSDCKMHLTKPLNNNHQTPEELFAASNEKLHQEAKEWLMRTEDAIFRPYRQEGISGALSVLATSAPACSSSPLFEPSFILPSNMSSASTHPMNPTYNGKDGHVPKWDESYNAKSATLDYYIFSRAD